jgi:hypothetical protein
MPYPIKTGNRANSWFVEDADWWEDFFYFLIFPQQHRKTIRFILRGRIKQNPTQKDGQQ